MIGEPGLPFQPEERDNVVEVLCIPPGPALEGMVDKTVVVYSGIGIGCLNVICVYIQLGIDGP